MLFVLYYYNIISCYIILDVLEQHLHHVTATHAKMAAFATTVGLVIFVNAKTRLLEATAPRVP